MGDTHYSSKIKSVADIFDVENLDEFSEKLIDCFGNSPDKIKEFLKDQYNVYMRTIILYAGIMLEYEFDKSSKLTLFDDLESVNKKVTLIKDYLLSY